MLESVPTLKSYTSLLLTTSNNPSLHSSIAEFSNAPRRMQPDTYAISASALCYTSANSRDARNLYTMSEKSTW